MKAQALIDLRDAYQTNYGDGELLSYTNRILDAISEEISRWNGEIGLLTSDLSFSSASNDYYKDLPADFIDYASDESGRPRVFARATVSGVTKSTRLYLAPASEVDAYEAETSDNTGTPSKFYLRSDRVYLHPRPADDLVVRLFFFGYESISTDADVLPWGGRFNEAIRAAVVAQARRRSEMWGHQLLDLAEIKQEMARVKRRVLGRRGFRMGFASGQGWTK